MKKFIFAAGLLVLSSAAIAAEVGVSVSIGQPGFYGQIDIGNAPQPRVIYAQPVLIQRPARYVAQQPVYMRVPPGHAKKWSKHCAKYNACGQRVYFVQDSWYNNEYAPRYRAQHGDLNSRRDNGRDGHPGNHVRQERNEKQERNGNHDRGNGKGNGHEKGNGKH